MILSACVAVPDVSWLPAWLTPGRLISAVPLNDTPPILLAVCNAVAVFELPEILPVKVALNVPLTVTLLNVLVPVDELTLPAKVVALTVPPK